MIIKLYLQQLVLDLLFMGKIFVLITQFRNLTNRRVGFQIDGGYCPLPELPPGKTRKVKQSRILRQFRELGPGWKIRVLVDGGFTGLELDPQVLLNHVRVLFRTERNGSGLDVVCIDGVRENRSDFLLRHRYFGCMRNLFWDSRPIEPNIARSDSRLATKLRNLEGNGLHLAPFVDTTSVKRHEENPIAEEKRKRDRPVSPAADKNDNIKTQPNVPGGIGPEKPMTIPVSPPSPPPPPAPPWMGCRGQPTVHTVDSSSDRTIAMDSFVPAILFVLALCLVRFLPMLLL